MNTLPNLQKNVEPTEKLIEKQTSFCNSKSVSSHFAVTENNPVSRYFMVTGVHPVMDRPDQVFKGVDAGKLAISYSDELILAGYGNVQITQLKEKK